MTVYVGELPIYSPDDALLKIPALKLSKIRRFPATFHQNLNILQTKNQIFIMSIIKLVGIGGTGAEFFKRTCNDPELSGINLFLIDTDEKSASNLGNVTKILIGKDLLKGKGAACKPKMGELAIHGDLDYVLKTLNLTKTDRVFIFAGFGGGTGTGVLPVLMGALKKTKIHSDCLLTLPFEFEGAYKKEIANEGLKKLQEKSYNIEILDNNDLAKMHPNMTIDNAFREYDNVILHKLK